MSTKNVIQKLTVELHYVSKDHAEEQHDVMVDKMRNIIMEELKKLFDRLSVPGEVITIDRLEINLGEFNPGTFFDELVEKTREELDQVMTKLVNDVRSAPDGRTQVHFSVPGGGLMTVDAAVTQRDRSSLEKLFYFLYYGVLPWSSTEMNGNIVQQLMDEAVQYQPETFITAIRQSAQRESLFARMAVQLNESQNIRTLALLSRSDAEIIRQWLDTAESLFTALAETGSSIPSAFSARNARREIIASWLKLFARKNQLWTEESVLENLPAAVSENLGTSGEREWWETLAAWMSIAKHYAAFHENFTTLKKRYAAYVKATEARRKYSESNQKQLGTSDPAAAKIFAEEENCRREFAEAFIFAAQLQSLMLKMIPGNITAVPAELMKPSEQMNMVESWMPEARKQTEAFQQLAPSLRAAIEKSFSIHTTAMLAIASAEGEAERRREEAAAELQRKTADAEQERKEKIRRFEEQRAAEEAERKKLSQERKNSNDEEEVVPDEDIYIRNAGIVLLWPYLNVFFTRLGWVENREFVSREAAEKAVLMLQWLLTGEDREWEEHELLLNKLLCGLPVSKSVPLSCQFTDEEKAEGLNLLQLVISRWEKMSRSSVKTLRETFMIREGKIRQDMNEWHLQVPRQGTLDILIDHLPWGLSMIKLPWNSYMIYVTW